MKKVSSSSFFAVVLLCAAVLCATPLAAVAGTYEFPKPAGFQNFGSAYAFLPNGNIVISDIDYSENGVASLGAVFLYSGKNFSLISTLRGASANDRAGGTIQVLANGNFVVVSNLFDRNGAANVGAVTWCNGVTGCEGTISETNSLVGSTAEDQIGAAGIIALSNGNYVVRSNNWDNGAVTNAGAVTWGNGNGGTVGVISAANSLVGSTAADTVGSNGVAPLPNGNYVVRTNNWDNGAVTNAGAVTWGNGNGGTVGAVSASNSLVGSTASDTVGSSSINVLPNGNYVVGSGSWDNGAITNAGAATWCNGNGGTVGAVSAANSIVGSTINDNVGNGVATVLPNGNYVIRSTNWDNGAIPNVGAVTWGNGNGGTVGAVSETNSLVGTTSGDNIANNGVTALTNGNYVVASGNWDNGAIVNAGAATWCNGAVGCTGAVSASNSLTGSVAGDGIASSGVTALSNGNYVVRSNTWDNGAIIDAGAATWGNGATGLTGTVSTSNSLVGSTANDNVGGSIAALTNGNYVVLSSSWDNGAVTDAGAATWGNGNGGTVGTISAANSLVGAAAGDAISGSGVLALTNGNYVVRSISWDNGATVNVGAVTWGNGATGTTGVVSTSNSLYGTTANDMVGGSPFLVLPNGNYVISSNSWDNGAVVNAGSITWGNGNGGTVGAVNASNSLVGTTASDSIGSGGMTAMPNSNYYFTSPNWDNGASADMNAATLGSGTGPTTGALTSSNSYLNTPGSMFIFLGADPTLNRLLVRRLSTNQVILFYEDTTLQSDGNFTNPAIWNNGVPTSLKSAVIPNGRTVTLDTTVSVGTVTIECGGALVGGSASAYVIGSVRKEYCGANGESFNYAVGTPNGYSPVQTTVTGTGAFSVIAVQSPHSTRNSAKSLQRFWNLTGSGITADLTFNYLDSDLPAGADEAKYRLIRYSQLNAANEIVSGASINPVANKVTVSNVSLFSDWLLAEVFSPTAAGVTVSGAVLFSPKGRGLMGAEVTLSNATGVIASTSTNFMGNYRFENIPAGETYIIEASHKRYSFNTQFVYVTDSMENLDFRAK